MWKRSSFGSRAGSRFGSAAAAGWDLAVADWDWAAAADLDWVAADWDWAAGGEEDWEAAAEGSRSRLS